jgi:RNA polymerase subunit RPABC4/transcription elongation factor Spt4
MSIPYYSWCLYCRNVWDEEIEVCPVCETGEGIIDEPYEVKDR